MCLPSLMFELNCLKQVYEYECKKQKQEKQKKQKKAI